MRTFCCVACAWAPNLKSLPRSYASFGLAQFFSSELVLLAFMLNIRLWRAKNTFFFVVVAKTMTFGTELSHLLLWFCREQSQLQKRADTFVAVPLVDTHIIDNCRNEKTLLLMTTNHKLRNRAANLRWKKQIMNMFDWPTVSSEPQITFFLSDKQRPTWN